MFLVMGLKSEISNYSCFKRLIKKYYCKKGAFFCVKGVGLCCILLSRIYRLTCVFVCVFVCACDNIQNCSCFSTVCITRKARGKNARLAKNAVDIVIQPTVTDSG
jgi:hypothetical protein